MIFNYSKRHFDRRCRYGKRITSRRNRISSLSNDSWRDMEICLYQVYIFKYKYLYKIHIQNIICRYVIMICNYPFFLSRVTDSDGWSSNYTTCEMNLSYGAYKLTYNVMGYYKWHSRLTFYPYIDVSTYKIEVSYTSYQKKNDVLREFLLLLLM